MPADRITALRISGLRCLEDVWLPLGGLTVLLGENGSGKSTILEALELLRRAATGTFARDVLEIHGGGARLFSSSSGGRALATRTPGLSLSVDIDSEEAPPLRYTVGLLADGFPYDLLQRRDLLEAPAGVLLSNHGIEGLRGAAFRDEQGTPKSLGAASGPLLGSFGINPPNSAIARASALLSRIAVHVPFEVTSQWISRAHDRRSVLRGSQLGQPTSRLERLGTNLTSAWAALKNDFDRAHWDRTMDYVRLGLGERFESINTAFDAAGGSIALRVKLRGRDEQLPAASLSDGQLAYLAFVALVRLHPEQHAALAFDEPELHLHPGLLLRIVSFFEELSEYCPVLLATHSRRLLDALEAPAESAILCELDANGETQLKRPDKASLDRWLERYDGLGSVLDAGYSQHVMTEPLVAAGATP